MPVSPPRHAPLALIPNILTSARLLAACIFPFAEPSLRLPLVLLAAVSDALDGLLARRLHAESRFGAFLDALADKAFALSTLLTILITGLAPWWQLAPLLARDITVAVISTHAVAWRGFSVFVHMPPRPLGKLTTFCIFAYLVALLLDLAILPPLFLLSAAISLAAAIDYIAIYRRRRRLELSRPG